MVAEWGISLTVVALGALVLAATLLVLPLPETRGRVIEPGEGHGAGVLSG